MEDKGILQSILERYLTEMSMDGVLGEKLSAEIIKLIEEDKCKKEALEKLLKSVKTENENS
jgi:hypothetical protein